MPDLRNAGLLMTQFGCLPAFTERLGRTWTFAAALRRASKPPQLVSSRRAAALQSLDSLRSLAIPHPKTVLLASVWGLRPSMAVSFCTSLAGMRCRNVFSHSPQRLSASSNCTELPLLCVWHRQRADTCRACATPPSRTFLEHFTSAITICHCLGSVLE